MAPGRGNSVFPNGYLESRRRWLEEEIRESDSTMPSRSTTGHTTTATSVGQNLPPSPPGTPAMPACVSHDRKLVTVRRITSVTDVDDHHVRVTIDGWTVVTRIDIDITEGRYVLFFEPDSFLPADSQFKDLFSLAGPLIPFNGKEGYRVGTWAWIDKNGNNVISQGFIIPLSKISEIDDKVRQQHFSNITKETEEGFATRIQKRDLAADFGVVKFEINDEEDADDEASDTASEAASDVADETKPEEQPSSIIPKVEQNTSFVISEAKSETRIFGPEVKPGPSMSISEPQPTSSGRNDTNGPRPGTNPSPPSWIIKTSMERVQNCPNLFTKGKYKRFQYQESVKMDGAAITIYFVPRKNPLYDALPELPPRDSSNANTFLMYAERQTGRLGVCTRNNDLLPHQLPNPQVPLHNIAWETAMAERFDKALTAECLLHGDGTGAIAVHAELVGPLVQGNPYGMTRHQLFIYAIDDEAGGGRKPYIRGGVPVGTKRRHPKLVEQFAARHGLRHVEVRGYHSVGDIASSHEELIRRADEVDGEGLVFKCCNDGRWFKVLSPKWILEKGDEQRAREMQQAKGKDKGKQKALPMEMEAQVATQPASSSWNNHFKADSEKPAYELAVTQVDSGLMESGKTALASNKNDADAQTLTSNGLADNTVKAGPSTFPTWKNWKPESLVQTFTENSSKPENSTQNFTNNSAVPTLGARLADIATSKVWKPETLTQQVTKAQSVNIQTTTKSIGEISASSDDDHTLHPDQPTDTDGPISIPILHNDEAVYTTDDAAKTFKAWKRKPKKPVKQPTTTTKPSNARASPFESADTDSPPHPDQPTDSENDNPAPTTTDPKPKHRGYEMSGAELDQFLYDIEHLHEWRKRDPAIRLWLDMYQPDWRFWHALFLSGLYIQRAREADEKRVADRKAKAAAAAGAAAGGAAGGGEKKKVCVVAEDGQVTDKVIVAAASEKQKGVEEVKGADADKEVDAIGTLQEGRGYEATGRNGVGKAAGEEKLKAAGEGKPATTGKNGTGAVPKLSGRYRPGAFSFKERQKALGNWLVDN
ncbi:hypothetical protein VTJ49DRAFT_1000 [Mycothermus thermophilus]|uniref:RNA ligase domain-containing protein n=1 Tax=Humicola insolens TaxID=85995 RepID=A0ABR3VEG3_HUMIN